jgi:hypothetical protein
MRDTCWSLLLSGLLLLSSCDSDKSPARTAELPAATSNEEQVRENPLEIEVEEVEPPATTKSEDTQAGNVVEPAPAEVESVAKEAPGPTYRLTYRPKKRSSPERSTTSFSLAPGERVRSTESVDEDDAETASAPDLAQAEKQAPALQAFLDQLASAPQTFELDSQLDTMLNCAQGTRLWIPSDVFVDSATGRAVTGTLSFQVQEVLTLADIIGNNLTTTSGDQLLETAGMVKLTATQNGRPLALRPGRELTIGLPRKGPEKPGMQVFGGSAEPHSQGNQNGPNVDWRLGGGRIVHDVPPRKPGKKVKPPTFPNALARNRHPQKRLAKKLGFTKAMAKELAQRTPTRQEQAWLTRVRRRMTPYYLRKEVVDAVEMTYTVGKDGVARNFKCIGGNDPALAAAVDSLIRRPQRWGRTNYRSTHTTRYYFFAGGYVQRVDQSTTIYEQALSDSLRLARLKQLQVAPTEEVDEDEQYDIAQSYLMSVGRLGWINCDRFSMVQPKDLTELRLAVPSGSSVQLIFREIRAVMAGVPDEKRVVIFSRIPKGALVTVLAFNSAQGPLQLATRQLVVGAPEEEKWDFRPVTVETMREELAKLEQ